MSDITDIVQRYRLALRHIWNSCFWVDPDLRTWDSVSSFRRLKLPLFDAIVAESLGIAGNGQLFGEEFRIIPNLPCGDGPYLPSMHVNKVDPKHPDSGVWEPLYGHFKAEMLSLTLVDFFDWSPLVCMDLRYYRVRIEGFRDYPEKVGLEALIDVTHANVIFTPVSQNQDVAKV
jgi:hypothetical protein